MTKTVPIKPTGEMLDRGADRMREVTHRLNAHHSLQRQVAWIYEAMLAAAPEAAPVAKIEEPMDEPRREDYALDSLYFDDLRRYIDSLRAALVEAENQLDNATGNYMEMLKDCLAERECAEQAESALAAAKAGAAPHQNADQPKAAPQAPCTPRRSSPGLAERPDSPNGVSLERAAILDETDSGVKPAGVAPRVGEYAPIGGLTLEDMTHREAPSCNGSQQESQKLTASDTVKTPSIHVDPSTGRSWVTLEDYNNLHERLEAPRQKLTGDAAGETTTPRTDAFSNVIAAQGTAKPAWYEFARGLERESSSLKAQLEGFRKDAERYRWLRNSHNQGANSPQGEGVMVVTDRPSKEPRYIGPLAWQLLDRAIDSALHPIKES
jgi:hypothetical protein